MTHDKKSDPLLDSGLMKINDVAAFLAVSRQKIYQLIKAGELSYTIVGEARRIPRASVLELASKKLVLPKRDRGNGFRGQP